MRELLPKNITIGDNTTPTVASRAGNTISTSTANKYIGFAAQFIDSRLSQVYVVPVIKIRKVTADLIANMLPASTDVNVSDVGGFAVGEAVLIEDSNGSEKGIVSAIPENVVEGGITVVNYNHITLSAPSQNAYDAGSDGMVHMITYPDPIPLIAARYACSLLLDKIFVADQSPDISGYGKRLRNLATVDMNGVLAGQIRLLGQEFNSRRFVRTQLFDAVSLSIDNLDVTQALEN
jgi:hypothetical protein